MASARYGLCLIPPMRTKKAKAFCWKETNNVAGHTDTQSAIKDSSCIYTILGSTFSRISLTKGKNVLQNPHSECGTTSAKLPDPNVYLDYYVKLETCFQTSYQVRNIWI